MLENTVFQATLGGGCFWCLEAFFQQLKGISDIQPGFSGGHTENPTYRQVCQGDTGHAEVIQFTYQPDIISYIDILKLFFTVHNPTTLNQQGHDVGTQYRSVVFYHDDYQQYVAQSMIAYLESEKIWQSIVTEVAPFAHFYPAEPEHFDYYRNNPQNRYCTAVIQPKLEKFKSLFADKLIS
ncbi:peptide-methionine (S)-S-oxide reductase MsrA [Cardiobacteriales bacterium ML27]|uniref:Peptide methionine sulfoxide reductase MsrA n=2 Tax=Ostreibacterium oceani TaxID=2654998 RepID=A0A6N7EVL1_9GAMM|nr:peptide-methionine (S)-S-oxide reductase MsrA [Ostreibacterium oceani]